MKTIRLTMAQALVRFLNQQYIHVDGKEQLFVEGVFTIFGHGNVLGIGQALEEDCGQLKVYQGKNEQGMAHVATAFAKQNNCHRIMACTSSIGPGAANMVTAAATATANNIPVLLLPADTHASRQPDPVLQQIEQIQDTTISTNDAFRPVCRYWDRVSRPEQLMSACLNAFRALTDGANRGAVCICLPQDVQAESYDYPETFFKKRVWDVARVVPEKRKIIEAVERIKAKKNPIFIVGGGVKYSLANETLLKVAKKWSIPIVETQAGKGAIVTNEPLNLGGLGVTGNQAANEIAKCSDCVIALGTRLTDFTTASKSIFENEDVEMIHINLSMFHAMKYDAFALCGDVKATLEEMLVVENGSIDFSSNLAKINEIKANWENEYDRLATIEYQQNFTPEVANQNDASLVEFANEFNSQLTQTTVLSKVNELIDHDAIVVGASGSLPGDMQRIWKVQSENAYHMEYGYSCMGYEVAAGLGCKMANEDKEVYVFLGDGSYLMLHSELITAMQLNKKINIVLFDNAGFGCINNLQMDQGMGSFHTEFKDENNSLLNIDYAKSASGYGAITYTVKTMEELVHAIEDSKKQTKSTLIDIKVLPKTMTHGYGAWWNVGVATTSKKESIQQASKRREQMMEKARKY